MTDTNERMSEEQINETIVYAGESDIAEDVLVVDLLVIIHQLRTDLAAANDRAEKAVEIGNAQTEYTNRVLAERDTLRDENAAMREALEWYEKQVSNCVKIGSIPDGEAARNNLSRDAGERARDTLARLATQEGDGK